MEIQELKQVMLEAGIVGAGGAGFPSYAKLDKRANTIILNCAECEPLLKVHQQLLEKNAFEIIEALNLVAQVLEAKEVILAIKTSYARTIEAVKTILSEKKFHADFQIGLLPEVYPVGDEVIAIYETTGKIVPPGRIPLDVGVAVFNVETMYNIYRAVFEKKPVTQTYLTIAGEVKEPKTVNVPIGMKVEEVIELAGGATVSEPVYICGGPMTGGFVSGSEVVTKTTNAILVFHKNHFLVHKKNSNNSINMKRAMAACCQCRMCTDLCPRNLIGHPIEPHAFMKAATTGVTKDVQPFMDTLFCSQCGICELYACDQGLSPRTLIGAYKNGLRANGIMPPKDIEGKEPHSLRDHRRVPMKRLTARLGLTDYNVPALLEDKNVIADVVKIKLSQHIGAPSVPIVKKGDKVTRGQMVGSAVKDKLSVPCHASIDGVVLDVNEKYVIIKNSSDV